LLKRIKVDSRERQRMNTPVLNIIEGRAGAVCAVSSAQKIKADSGAKSG